MTRLFSIGLLFLCLAAAPARADVTLRLHFAYLDAPGTGLVAVPDVMATDLLGGAALSVTQVPPSEEDPVQKADVILPDAAFNGPYARLRVAVSGLRLPEGDSKSGDDIRFAFEVVLRRANLPEVIDLRVPVVTSSRRGAMKPYMDLPQIAEELPARFFMAMQWMSLYSADEAAVTASPRSFALHRLISRAIADFAIRMADGSQGPMLIIPSVELQDILRVYWQNEPDGRNLHLRAYADARTILWLDLARSETLLSEARRAGLDAPALCNEARALLTFFDTFPPDDAEAAKVDSMFPNPGTLTGYIDGRNMDVLASCTRLRI